MPTVSEQISKEQAQVQGKTDANISNDANNLGGIPADEYATKKYVNDFHNSKDIEQKEYIDKQDGETLKAAKEYTNSQIRNQDFSGFAELKDVNALKENLEKKITDGDNTQKSYTDTKIKQVVDDTNANFKDVENSIGQLNNNMNNLFQSVSSGKSKIAGAITDKGVSTSANDTFDTMAGNIRKITTGGGSIDPNFVNTSDATATASDILNGKTAYVKGQKVYGNLIYSKPNEYEVNPSNPYPERGEVELIYGEKEGEMTISKVKHEEYLDYGYPYDISSDNRLLVAYKDNKIKTFLKGINALGEEAWVQEKNQTGQLITPEYTFEELNITNIENYKLKKIKFSIMNANQNESGYECRIALLFLHSKSTTVSEAKGKVFIFRISTYDGKIKSGNEDVQIGNGNSTYYNRWEISQGSSTDDNSYSVADLVWSPFSYKLAVVSGDKGCVYKLIDTYKGEEDFSKSTKELLPFTTATDGMVYDTQYKYATFANSDRIFNTIRTANYGGTKYIHTTYILDTDFEVVKTHTSGVYSYEESTINLPMSFTNDGLYLIGRDGNIYSCTINYVTGEITTQLLADFGLSYVTDAIFSYDNKFLIAVTESPTTMINVIATDFSNKQFTLLCQYSHSNINKISNLRSFEIMKEQEILSTISDKKELLGLKYQGQTFYNSLFNAGRFTARQGDVREGKTFIGWQGIPETGTMEVKND